MAAAHGYGGWLVTLLAAVAVAGSCTLDFEKFEGEPTTTTGSGGTSGGTTTGGGGTGGSGGVGGSGGNGGSGGVIPVECTNTVMDGEETDVDCGGSQCPACENGLDCLLARDCISGFCDSLECAPCTDHPDCAGMPDTWCDLNTNGGQCMPLEVAGSPCADAAECLSGNCQDGFCCDLACAGECEACSAALNGNADGVCSPIPPMQDPQSECQPTEICNGSGTCVPFCGFQPAPPGGTCPAVCTGGCTGGTCIIDCNAPNPSCLSTIVNCPAGFACTVQCFDASSCRQATINCPATYACNVDCTGQSACWDAIINCSNQGTCDLSCGSASAACRDTNLICGTNDCVAACAGSGYVPIVAGCPNGCTCTGC